MSKTIDDVHLSLSFARPLRGYEPGSIQTIRSWARPALGGREWLSGGSSSTSSGDQVQDPLQAGQRVSVEGFGMRLGSRGA